VGSALCLAGVAGVLWERLPSESAEARRGRRGALLLALATVGLEALGTFLSKLGMGQGGTAGPLEATFVRLLAGAVGVAGLGLARREIGGWLRSWAQPGFAGSLVTASIVGTFVGIGLSMAALWLTDVSLASVLNATTPLFVLPLAALVLRERVTARAVLGALTAVAGVIVLLVPG
jgi:drug/metabolite transporter (DMT)-like permease